MTALAALRLAPVRLGAGRLSLGFVGSVALHVGIAALLLHLTLPGPLPDQPTPKSSLKIQTQAVPEDQAKAQAPAGTRAQAEATKGQPAAQGAIAASSAQAIAPQATAAPALAPPAQALAAAPPPPVTAAAAPPARVVTAAAPPTQALAAAPPPPVTAALAPAAQAIAATAAPAQPTPAVAPNVAPVQATLAWAGEAGTVDPVSLKAIASFMRPGDAKADDVQDGLAGLLASVPCARLQAEFDPATGAIALRGHVPDEGLKAPLLAALQAQLGTGIKVQEDLAILPRPQCGALAGIADVGLAQSQDQLTNPRLIGADAQARTFTYGAGQSMVLDLAAPDYDAYVYVDYFDADGEVIHLAPNARVPLKLRPAKSAFKVGAEGQGEPFLQITVGPPYGQEIAVAFAASAPLYDGVRPLSEPAGPYLDFLKARVAAARAKDAGFKGEWVYFMVVTHP